MGLVLLFICKRQLIGKLVNTEVLVYSQLRKEKLFLSAKRVLAVINLTAAVSSINCFVITSKGMGIQTHAV